MLFSKQKCIHCGEQIDPTNKICPSCGKNVENSENRILGNGYTSISPKRQIGLFCFGTIGLEILSFVALLFLMGFNSPENIRNSFGNFIPYILLLIILIFLLVKFQFSFKITSRKIKNIIIGLYMGILLIFGQEVYSLLLMQFGAVVSNNTNQDVVDSIVKSFPILSIIVLGFIGPICEEITYRLGLFSFLCRINKILAYIVSVLFFAFAHFSIEFIFQGNITDFVNELLNLPYYIICGAILTFAYDRYGLETSSTAHIVNNIVTIVATLLVVFGI